jgi:hypothetical protein
MKRGHTLLLALGLVVLVSAALIPSALSGAISQDAPGLELVGHLGGANNGVFVQGDYAYTGFGPELAVIDISDPAHPTRVGWTFLPNDVLSVWVSGSYIYALSFNGLWVLDISDPTHPVEVGSSDTTGGWVFHVLGDYAYVINDNGLDVVDISNPSAPHPEGNYDTPGNARDVHVVGQYAYVTDESAGLQIVDVSNPVSPTLESTCSLSGTVEGVYVSGSHAYVTTLIGDFAADNLRVVDVSDPLHPQEVGSEQVLLGYPGDAQDVYVSGNYAYVSGSAYISGGRWFGGVEVVDVSDPQHPDSKGNYVTPDTSDTYDVYVSGDHAFLTSSYDGLFLVVDVSDPTNPTEAGAYSVPQSAYDVYVSGNYAYVADWGLKVVDVSAPAYLTLVGSYSAPVPLSANQRLHVSGDYAYVGDCMGRLNVVDISNPTQPTEVGFYDTCVQDVAVAGTHAYVANSSDSSLVILDVADPAHPAFVTSYDTPGSANGVHISGNHAYVSDGNLQIVDISDPAHPAEAGSYDTPGNSTSVYVAGNYAYVADGQAGLHIVNVSDPAHPSEAGTFDDTGSAWISVVHVSGNRAYVGGGSGKLWVVDVSDPAHPAEVSVHAIKPIWQQVSSAYVAGDHVYVTGGELFVLAPQALQVSPTRLTLLAQAGGDDPAPRTLNVASSGSALTWTVTLSPTVGWLEVAPLSGVTPATVTASAHVSGLGSLVYDTQLLIESEPPVQGSPQSVPVTFIVAETVYDIYLPFVTR